MSLTSAFDKLLALDIARLPAPLRAASVNQPMFHHVEDGKVGDVPKQLHDRAAGGVAHPGGTSMTDNPLF